jgi:predicted nucleic acid-binding protein
MMRGFVDASVLYAACYSETGSARELLLESVRGHLILVVSPHVLEEVERNLVAKAHQALPAFETLIKLVDPEKARKPTLEELEQAAAYTALKDAPIVAAAVAANVDYLVTWDRKHLINPPKVAERSGLRILTPGELMDSLREEPQ